MPLNESDIAHLIRRTESSATEARISELAALPSISAAVDSILEKNTSGGPSTPTGQFFPFNMNGLSWEGITDLRRWWLNEMAFGSQPLREKMGLFWHGHFTSHTGSTSWIGHIIDQLQLYRGSGFGDFRQLTKDMSIQPLMLAYLNNDRNTKYQINENFARELLELFTIGLNTYGLLPGQQFPYTQADIVSSAKAWTGENTKYWQSVRETYEYKPTNHVTGDFTFLGETKNFRGFDIIDRVTTADPYRTITARHIATKIWSYFVYTNPDVNVISSLVTSTGFASNWNIKTLLRAIFTHPEFYTPKAKLGLVSTPAEFVARVLKISGEGVLSETNRKALGAMVDMAQELFDPPNVAGWKANGYWLSTSQIGARGNFARQIFDLPASNSIFRDLDSAAIDTTITTAARRIGLVSIQNETRANLANWLTEQRSRSGANADFRSSGLLHLLIMSPDFQLS